MFERKINKEKNVKKRARCVYVSVGADLHCIDGIRAVWKIYTQQYNTLMIEAPMRLVHDSHLLPLIRFVCCAW